MKQPGNVEKSRKRGEMERRRRRRRRRERRRKREKERERERGELELCPSTDDSFCSARFFATTPSSHPRGWMIYDRPRDTGHPPEEEAEGEKETGRGRYILIPEEFLMYVRVHLCFKAAIVSANESPNLWPSPPNFSKSVVMGIWLFLLIIPVLLFVFLILSRRKTNDDFAFEKSFSRDPDEFRSANFYYPSMISFPVRLFSPLVTKFQAFWNRSIK